VKWCFRLRLRRISFKDNKNSLNLWYVVDFFVNYFNIRFEFYYFFQATTSIVGHLLGVGDRHLGNILLDIQSGELVHIDFAVVSDIGLRLRVPELASCRLSPNIIQALGPHSTTSSVSPLSWAAADTMACARVNNDALLSLVGSWLNEPFTQGVRSQGPLAQLCHKLETDICVKEICSRLSSSVFTKRINALIEQVAPLLASVRAVVQSASQEQESRNRINDLRELIQHNQTEAVQAETMLAQGRESVALMYAPHVCDAATATWQRRKAANDEIGRMRMELTQVQFKCIGIVDCRIASYFTFFFSRESNVMNWH
jgi:hypothetical protein